MTPELLKSEADNCDAQSGLSPAPLLGIAINDMKTEIEKLKAERLASDACHMDALRDLEYANDLIVVAIDSLKEISRQTTLKKAQAMAQTTAKYLKEQNITAMPNIRS
jgi:hypothetical protein